MAFIDSDGKYQRYKEGCLFCDIYKTKTEVFYENRTFYSRFDRLPLTPGHTEIIPKTHIENFHDLSKTEFSDLHEATNKTIEKILSIDLKSIYSEWLDNLTNINNLNSNNLLHEKFVKYCKNILNHTGIEQKFIDYNFVINNGKLAGRTVHHLHIHIIPRYAGDVEDPTGGIRHMFPGEGNYLK